MHVPEDSNFSKSCEELFFSEVYLPNLFCKIPGICLNMYKLQQVLPCLSLIRNFIFFPISCSITELDLLHILNTHTLTDV